MTYSSLKKSQPEIVFYRSKGELFIKGNSYRLENTLQFFGQISQQIQDFLVRENNRQLTLHLQLGFLDGNSLRRISEILYLLEDLQNKKHKNITINWYFHKKDIGTKEEGQDLSTEVKLPFNFLPLN